MAENAPVDAENASAHRDASCPAEKLDALVERLTGERDTLSTNITTNQATLQDNTIKLKLSAQRLNVLSSIGAALDKAKEDAEKANADAGAAMSAADIVIAPLEDTIVTDIETMVADCEKKVSAAQQALDQALCCLTTKETDLLVNQRKYDDAQAAIAAYPGQIQAASTRMRQATRALGAASQDLIACLLRKDLLSSQEDYTALLKKEETLVANWEAACDSLDTAKTARDESQKAVKASQDAAKAADAERTARLKSTPAELQELLTKPATTTRSASSASPTS